MGYEAPKSAGCLVNWDDLPRIFASITVFGACLGFGAGIAVLGASIAQLADGINVPDTGIGRMFVYRGFGFLIGALLSIKLLRMPNIVLSKHMICCVLILIAGFALSLVPVVAQNYPEGPHFKHNWVLVTIVGFLFFIEGMCFGGIDAFSALAIAEMWGQRTQPWMQAKNLFSNFGCLIGPALVEAYGYRHAYLFIALIGCVSTVGFAFDALERCMQSYLKLPKVDRSLVCAELDAVSRCLQEEPSGDEYSPGGESNEWSELVHHMFDNSHIRNNLNLESPRGLATTCDFSSPRKRTSTLDFTATPMHSPRGNAAVTFASPELARSVRLKHKPVGIFLVSYNVRVLLALFVFWDLGLLCSYGAWISTYVETFELDHELSHSLSEHDAQSAAAEVLAVFYAAQILGSVLSVPGSVIFSTTALLRCQLVLAVTAGVLMCIPHSSYSTAGWLLTVTGLEAGLMGLALGCMYPLIMTVANDYGATMTSNSTIAVVLGGCVGEAAAPFAVSLAIAHFGPAAFVVCICALIAALVVTYAVLHFHLQQTPTALWDSQEQVATPQTSPVHASSRGLHAKFDYSSPTATSSSKSTRFDLSAFNTESPRTLMNYTGVSSAGSHDSLGSLDPETGETEFAPLVIPSTRYHTVRANGNVINTSNAYSNGSNNSSVRSSPGICMVNMGSTSVTGTSATSAGSSLYARSFRVPLFPAIEHPGYEYEAVDTV